MLQLVQLFTSTQAQNHTSNSLQLITETLSILQQYQISSNHKFKNKWTIFCHNKVLLGRDEWENEKGGYMTKQKVYNAKR